MIRYFSLSPGEMEPRGLLRLTETDKTVDLDRWDHKSKGWVSSPASLKYLIGDDPDLREVTEQSARKLISEWS